MNPRNAPCPCGSGQKYKRCCRSVDRSVSRVQGQGVVHLPPPPGLDPVTTEAYLRVQEVMVSPDAARLISEGMVLLRRMFREGGPLGSLRWSWEQLVPPVERHIGRVMEEVEDTDERHALLFERCAPKLLSAERLARMDEVLRRELMSPERTEDERRALAAAVMELVSAPPTPPYSHEELGLVSWLMMGQVDEWMARRERAEAFLDRVLGPVADARRGWA
ncbi:SEC-C domain-containing protein [Archangium violaceum]|uniref:SEC-C domain-containing protein n=1 Tax=Archangium violaceum TaxID=83451 RepID=UPI00195191B6|nr:SEC-C domain-containing protein [Archangium violaceum]QRN96334.1 SEC-C domain-containing protein [Archangium violaceum]